MFDDNRLAVFAYSALIADILRQRPQEIEGFRAPFPIDARVTFRKSARFLGLYLSCITGFSHFIFNIN
jgi:hypothetical protein